LGDSRDRASFRQISGCGTEQGARVRQALAAFGAAAELGIGIFGAFAAAAAGGIPNLVFAQGIADTQDQGMSLSHGQRRLLLRIVIAYIPD
jgi:hypothetical protein